MRQEADQPLAPGGTTAGTLLNRDSLLLKMARHMYMQRHAACSRHDSVGKDVVGAPPFLELLLRELELNVLSMTHQDGSTAEPLRQGRCNPQPVQSNRPGNERSLRCNHNP